MRRWSTVDAKARLSEIIANLYVVGPQMTTRAGRDEVVLVQADA